jgi:hypothetical protein
MSAGRGPFSVLPRSLNLASRRAGCPPGSRRGCTHAASGLAERWVVEVDPVPLDVLHDVDAGRGHKQPPRPHGIPKQAPRRRPHLRRSSVGGPTPRARATALRRFTVNRRHSPGPSTATSRARRSRRSRSTAVVPGWGRRHREPIAGQWFSELTMPPLRPRVALEWLLTASVGIRVGQEPTGVFKDVASSPSVRKPTTNPSRGMPA